MLSSFWGGSYLYYILSDISPDARKVLSLRSYLSIGADIA